VRTDQGQQYSFRSTDHGDNWSAPEPTTLRSPASPASIMRLPGSDKLLAVFNDFSGQFPFATGKGTYSGRTPLASAISSDGGRTWHHHRLLEGDPQKDYCYTAVHYVGDYVLLSYMAISTNLGRPIQLCIRRTALKWIAGEDDTLELRARAVLHHVMDTEASWIKIHAAEALMAGGEAIEIRDKFLALAPQADSVPFRVGIWRVLANTSPTAEARAKCVAEVEKIYLNAKSPDRSQAIETLCKLRVRVSDAVLEDVRRNVSDPTAPLHAISLWSARLADEPQSLDHLIAALGSVKDDDRAIAAYSLRFLRETDPTLLRALASAADAEKPGTRAYAYLLSAAFASKADPSKSAAWRAKLEGILANGSTEARFEACYGLLSQAHLADLPKYTPLLNDDGADSRVGAALTILYVHARE
jgi:hypothetical protein